MRQLRFVALAEDGGSIVVVDGTGEQFRLPVDERLKAAARGDGARMGQMEIRVDSSLRPAEIQARVRAGESVEEVAKAASVPLSRVLPFARAVMLERSLIAEEARGARCRPWQSGHTPVLGQLIDARLVERGYDPDEANWDAARRDNGTWRVSVRYGSGKRAREAVWTYDRVGRQVRANDDTARALVAETAEPEPELLPEAETDRPLAVVREVRRKRPAAPAARSAVEEIEDAEAPVGAAASEPLERAEQPELPEPVEDAPRRAAAGGGRRTPVPAWEDILFGVRRNG
jgi:hypothetical protein